MQLRGDSKEPSIEPLQATGGFLVVNLTAVRPQEIPRCGQGLTDSGKIGTGDTFGERERRDAVKLNGVLAGEVVLAL